jgi:hypothetical protein
VYSGLNLFARTTLRALDRSVVALLLCASGEYMQAQQVQGSLAVAGGAATDVRGITSRAVTVAPAVTFAPDPRAVLSFGLNGTRFDNSQWAAGGTAASALRSTMGTHAALTFAGNASLTRTSYDLSYALADVVPAIEVNAGAVGGYVGVHGSAATTSATTETQTAPGPFGGTPLVNRSTASQSRALRGALFGGSVRIPSAADETMIAGVREEHARIDSMSYVDRSVSLVSTSGRLSIGGSLGLRNERGSRSTFGNGAMSISVNPAVAIELNAGAYPANHLVGTPAGRYVNIGLSLRTSSAAPNTPSAAGVPAPLAGVTRFAIRDDAANRVELAGDFTNWKTIAARRASNGVWYVDLRIPPGQYRYAFRADGSAWKVPDGVAAVDDDFGGKSAVLVVSAPK